MKLGVIDDGPSTILFEATALGYALTCEQCEDLSDRLGTDILSSEKAFVAEMKRLGIKRTLKPFNTTKGSAA